MSDLKDKPLFPYTIADCNKIIQENAYTVEIEHKDGDFKVSEPIPFLNSNYAGMTFNMWMVGMIANGLCSNPAIYDEKINIVELSVEMASRIIEKLQEEKSK